jgi:HAD superfamily hydrolase (TIGR01509 family)
VLKGVIFDMDGVIIDNNAFHEIAWIEFCRIHGVSLTTHEIHHQVYGRIARDTLEYIFKKQLTTEEINNYIEQKEKIYRNIYSKLIKPNLGLIHFLEILKSNHMKLGMATSAPPGNVDFTFLHVPVKQYFDVILDADSIINGKPHPEIYSKAIGMLHLKPSECVIFEDSIPGIRAGISSGAHVVGVATTHKIEELKEVKWVINDFSGISMDFLHQVVDQA